MLFILLRTGSSGELRSHSFLPKCHLSSSKLRVLTPHAMSSLHHQGPPRDCARSNTSVLASQVEEPMLTLLALLAPESCCTSQAEEPMLTLLVSWTSPTSRGTNVDLACLRIALYT